MFAFRAARDGDVPRTSLRHRAPPAREWQGLTISVDPSAPREADFYLGATEGQHVWLIYRPDLDWLKTPEAALTLSRAKAFAATDPDKRHLVFAPARFVSQKMLAEQNIPVEFVPLPFALYRIDRS